MGTLAVYGSSLPLYFNRKLSPASVAASRMLIRLFLHCEFVAAILFVFLVVLSVILSLILGIYFIPIVYHFILFVVLLIRWGIRWP